MSTAVSRMTQYFAISLSCVLGLVVFNPAVSSGAPNAQGSLSATNEQITLLYIDILNFYKEGKYDQALGAIERIKSLLRCDPYASNVRKTLQIQPTDSVLAEMAGKFRQRQIELQQAKRMISAGDYERAGSILNALAQESPQSGEVARYLASISNMQEKNRLEQQRTEKLTQEKAQRDAQAQARAVALVQQREQAQRERERLVEEREAIRQQKAAELTRQAEELRIARERQAQQLQAERVARLDQIQRQKQVQAADREREIQELAATRQKQREESARKQEEFRLARERQAQEQEAKRLELLRQKQAQEREVVQENTQRQEEARLKKEVEQERLAQRETSRQEEFAQKRQELVARQQALTRQKEELRLQHERQQQEEVAARQARMQELARQKEELRLQKELQAQERESARLARAQELTRQREEELKRLADEKSRREHASRMQQEQITAQRSQRLAQLEAEKQQRTEAQVQARELERREEIRRAAAEKQSREEEVSRRQAAIQAKAQAQARLRAQRQEQLPAQPPKQVAAPTSKPAPTAEITTAAKTRADIQESILSDAKHMKHVEDKAKIARADKLWDDARQHYRRGFYTQAIAEFQEIIQIEGNPRIKYTPYAKEYIQKAEEKIVEKESQGLTAEIEKKDTAMMEEVKKTQIPPYIQPPQKAEPASETTLIEPPLIRKKLKKKVSLDFEKVDLKSVVNFLAEESGVNIVISQKVLDIAPKVSTRFSETTVDEVVKYITKSLGLVYRIDKEVVWIAHPEEIAEEALETRVYYLSKGGGLFTEFSPISSSSETGLGGSSAQITKVTTIEDTLREIVPWPQDAKLTYDKRLNALIVRNTPQNLQMLEDILYSLDVTPVQVLIEARFIEVDVTDTKELGLTWKLNSNASVEEETGAFKHGVAKDSGVDFTSFANESSGLNLAYKGLLTDPQFQVVLHAMEESKKIKTLSSPRITTLNNQVATIKVVDEWIYPTRYEYEIVQFDLTGDGDYNDAGETTYKNVPKDFLRRDVGILLKVIPAVGSDKKTINLSLIPEVSEGTADGFSYTGDVTLPKFTSRNLSTTVVVNSGETVVLGGLIKENRTKTLTKVPVLADIPFVGAFFRKNADSIERKNLIIFVTAKVLTPEGDEVVITQK